MMGAYTNGRKRNTRGRKGKAKNLKRNLSTYQQSEEMAGDMPLAGGQRRGFTGQRGLPRIGTGLAAAVEVKQNGSTV